MIAIDTSALVAFLHNDNSAVTDQVERILEDKIAVFPPVVVSELLSDPELKGEFRSIILGIPMLSVLPGFWQRAGELRSKLLAKHQKARLADTLIAQSCIDHGVLLVTRDADFKAFQRISSLSLL
jgi:predicted nucleic acid-binding protein